jgi:hypothetical protein
MEYEAFEAKSKVTGKVGGGSRVYIVEGRYLRIDIKLDVFKSEVKVGKRAVSR